MNRNAVLMAILLFSIITPAPLPGQEKTENAQQTARGFSVTKRMDDLARRTTGAHVRATILAARKRLLPTQEKPRMGESRARARITFFAGASARDEYAVDVRGADRGCFRPGQSVSSKSILLLRASTLAFSPEVLVDSYFLGMGLSAFL